MWAVRGIVARPIGGRGEMDLLQLFVLILMIYTWLTRYDKGPRI